mgnify:CR=1 FL=1
MSQKISHMAMISSQTTEPGSETPMFLAVTVQAHQPSKTAHTIKGDLHQKMDSAVDVGGIAEHFVVGGIKPVSELLPVTRIGDAELGVIAAH